MSEPCEIDNCDHKIHCDNCGKGMAELTETGVCPECEADGARSAEAEETDDDPEMLSDREADAAADRYFGERQTQLDRYHEHLERGTGPSRSG